MRILWLALGMVLLLACSIAVAQTQPPTVKVTVSGKWARVMAIGGESTGWAVQLDEHTPVDGKEVTTLEVKFGDPKQAEKYENKRVKVRGTVTHRHGVETGDVMVLDVTSIKSLKPLKPVN
jgi:hypothetical protein